MSLIQAEFRPHPLPGMTALLTFGARGWKKGSWAWARLDDGRLSVLRLPENARFTKDDLAAWVEQLSEDLCGERLAIDLPRLGCAAPVLYAAAVCPLEAGSGLNDLPVGAFGLAPHWPSAVRAALLTFRDGLDADILEGLRALNTGRVYDSVRNYNRMIQLDPERRRNRLQALRQYPSILGHVLLTPHHYHDYMGGKAHRWRMHDDAVVAAVDAGTALIPALADRFGAEKSVFKSPLMTQRWPNLELARQEVLWLLDGITAHCRPSDLDTLKLAKPVFAWLKRHGLTGRQTLREFGANFFRAGIAPAMARLDRRYPTHALDDMADFIDALEVEFGRQYPPGNISSGSPWDRDVLAEWLRQYGLWRLLEASTRWHAWVSTRWPAACAHWLPMAGSLEIEDWHCLELDSAEALAEEGRSMGHCVATRWMACRDDGARIFSLTGPDGERGTAQFDLIPSSPRDDYVFDLAELRGLGNAAVSLACVHAAHALGRLLNAPENSLRRRAIAASLGQGSARQPAPVPLDPESARMAQALSGR